MDQNRLLGATPTRVLNSFKHFSGPKNKTLRTSFGLICEQTVLSSYSTMDFAELVFFKCKTTLSSYENKLSTSSLTNEISKN